MIELLEICAVIFAAALLACFVAYQLGIKRGRDSQRIDDICEQWKLADARRGSDGRFRRAVK